MPDEVVTSPQPRGHSTLILADARPPFLPISTRASCDRGPFLTLFVLGLQLSPCQRRIAPGSPTRPHFGHVTRFAFAIAMFFGPVLPPTAARASRCAGVIDAVLFRSIVDLPVMIIYVFVTAASASVRAISGSACVFL